MRNAAQRWDDTWKNAGHTLLSNFIEFIKYMLELRRGYIKIYFMLCKVNKNNVIFKGV